jgi:hypothetical protein
MHEIRTTRPLTKPSVTTTVLRCLLLSSLMGTIGRAAEPRPSPHRFIPAKGLVAYVEFDGLVAHVGAWKATAAYGILVKTPAGSMMTELATQVVDRLCKELAGGKLTGADLIALNDHLMQRGFAVAVHGLENGSFSCTFVLSGFGEKPLRERLERLLQLVFAPQAAIKLPDPIRLRGRDVHQVEDDLAKKLNAVVEEFPLPAQRNAPVATSLPWLSWWYEGDDLVLISGPSEHVGDLFGPARTKTPAAAHTGHRAEIFDVIEGKQPNVATHAGYLAASAEGKDIAGFESDGLFFIDPGGDKGLFAAMGGSQTAKGLLGLGTASIPTAQVTAMELARLPATGIEPPPLLLPGPPAPRDGDHKAGAPSPSGFGAPLGPELAPKTDPPQKPEQVAAANDQPDRAAIFGLDGVRRIVGRWGFHGKALLTDVRLEAPAPRKGIVAWLDQPAFAIDHLPAIPRDTTLFGVDSLDLAASYQKLVGAFNVLEPGVAGEFGQWERALRDATGLRLREDLLNHLGPSWSLFRLPSMDRNGRDEDELDPTEFALLAGVRDPEAFAKVLDSIASRVNQYFRDAEKRNDKQQGNRDVDPPVLALEPLKAPDRGYQLTSPARLVPWLGNEVRPTILVGKSFIAYASNLERAREALAAESPAAGPWRPAGELAKAFECLPERLTLLIVGDHRDSAWPGLIADLPSNVQTLSAMLGGVAELDSSPEAGLLGVLGIPRPGSFRLRIDPALIPKADQLRPYLFPSVLAATADDRGFRLICREALPLACFKYSAALKSSVEWTKAKGLERKVKIDLGLLQGIFVK